MAAGVTDRFITWGLREDSSGTGDTARLGYCQPNGEVGVLESECT